MSGSSPARASRSLRPRRGARALVDRHVAQVVERRRVGDALSGARGRRLRRPSSRRASRAGSPVGTARRGAGLDEHLLHRRRRAGGLLQIVQPQAEEVGHLLVLGPALLGVVQDGNGLGELPAWVR